MQRRHPQDQDDYGREPLERLRGYGGYDGRRDDREPSRESWRQGGRDREYDERLGRWQFDESNALRSGSYGGGGYAEGPRRWQNEGYSGGRGEGEDRFRRGSPYDEGDFGGSFGREHPRERSFGGERGYGFDSGGGRGSESDRFGHVRRFSGRGPKGYQRSDERIRDDVCDRLTFDPEVDASEIGVTVENCEVTLEGTVEDRWMKRRAEDCADEIPGVRQVHNRLQIQQPTGEHLGSRSGPLSKAHRAGRAS